MASFQYCKLVTVYGLTYPSGCTVITFPYATNVYSGFVRTETSTLSYTNIELFTCMSII